MNESDAIETIEDAATTIKIFPDDDPIHPRKDLDNLGTIHSFHHQVMGDESGEKWEIQDYMESTPMIYLPLSFHEHGEIKIFTDHYTEPWDSGSWGVIYVTLEDIRKEYGWKYVTANRAKRIRSYLTSEVETYSQYVNGEVYGYKVYCSQCNTELDSERGYYGYDHEGSGLLSDARGHQCPVCTETIKRLESITAEV